MKKYILLILLTLCILAGYSQLGNPTFPPTFTKNSSGTIITTPSNANVQIGGSLSVGSFSINGVGITQSTVNATSFYQNGGNSFGASGIIGLNDAFNLGIMASNTVIATFTSTRRVGFGTTAPANFLTATGFQPTEVGTTPGTSAATTGGIVLTGAVGGNTSIGSTGVGGIGGALQVIGGSGGTATSATVSSTAGAGGQAILRGGIGSVNSTTTTTLTKAGAGGAITVSGGAGGIATKGLLVTTGGNGGAATFSSGSAGQAADGYGTINGGAGGVLNITSGAGGDAGEDLSTTNNGGASGALNITVSAGGNTAEAITTNTGGNAGALSVLGGVGGSAQSGVTAVGGTGTSIGLTAGNGGAATLGSGTNTGGNAGNITLTAGTRGTGATANGTNGVISLVTYSGTAMTIADNSFVGIGITSPTVALHVVGSIGSTATVSAAAIYGDFRGTASTSVTALYVGGNAGVIGTVYTGSLSVTGKIELPASSITYSMLASNLTGTQVLTDGATITWNTATGAIASVTLTANRALSVTNPISGLTGTILVKQDGTGSRTLSLPAGSVVVNGGAGAITLTTTANAIDILTYIYVGAVFYWTYGKNFN